MRPLKSIALFTIVLAAAAIILIKHKQSLNPLVVNDISGINPIVVNNIVTPTTIEEIQAAVRESKGPVSIGGGRFSMGGQTATENAVQHGVKIEGSAY